MKKIIYVALLMIAVLIVSGCGKTSTEDTQVNTNAGMQGDNPQTIEELTKMAEEMQEEYEATHGEEEPEGAAITGDTMEYCHGSNGMMTLTYYFAENAAYKLMNTPESDQVEQVITETQNCASILGGSVRYSCVPIGAGTFAELKSGLMQEKDGLGMVVGLTCSDIAYDETVFATE